MDHTYLLPSAQDDHAVPNARHLQNVIGESSYYLSDRHSSLALNSLTVQVGALLSKPSTILSRQFAVDPATPDDSHLATASTDSGFISGELLTATLAPTGLVNPLEVLPKSTIQVSPFEPLTGSKVMAVSSAGLASQATAPMYDWMNFIPQTSALAGFTQDSHLLPAASTILLGKNSPDFEYTTVAPEAGALSFSEALRGPDGFLQDTATSTTMSADQVTAFKQLEADLAYNDLIAAIAQGQHSARLDDVPYKDDGSGEVSNHNHRIMANAQASGSSSLVQTSSVTDSFPPPDALPTTTLDLKVDFGATQLMSTSSSIVNVNSFNSPTTSARVIRNLPRRSRQRHASFTSFTPITSPSQSSVESALEILPQQELSPALLNERAVRKGSQMSSPVIDSPDKTSSASGSGLAVSRSSSRLLQTPHKDRGNAAISKPFTLPSIPEFISPVVPPPGTPSRKTHHSPTRRIPRGKVKRVDPPFLGSISGATITEKSSTVDDPSHTKRSGKRAKSNLDVSILGEAIANPGLPCVGVVLPARDAEHAGLPRIAAASSSISRSVMSMSSPLSSEQEQNSASDMPDEKRILEDSRGDETTLDLMHRSSDVMKTDLFAKKLRNSIEKCLDATRHIIQCLNQSRLKVDSLATQYDVLQDTLHEMYRVADGGKTWHRSQNSEKSIHLHIEKYYIFLINPVSPGKRARRTPYFLKKFREWLHEFQVFPDETNITQFRHQL